MDEDKRNLIEKTGDAVSSAAEAVTEGLKSAGKAVAGAITPKPIKAGDTLIFPSADPSFPPVIVPAKRRMQRTATRKADAPGRRRTKVAKTTRASTRKRSAKSTASRPNAARKSKTAPKPGTTRKAARRPARKTRAGVLQKRGGAS